MCHIASGVFLGFLTIFDLRVKYRLILWCLSINMAFIRGFWINVIFLWVEVNTTRSEELALFQLQEMEKWCSFDSSQSTYLYYFWGRKYTRKKKYSEENRTKSLMPSGSSASSGKILIHNAKIRLVNILVIKRKKYIVTYQLTFLIAWPLYELDICQGIHQISARNITGKRKIKP